MRKSVEDSVNLLAHHRNRTAETSCVLEEGRNASQIKMTANHPERADYCGYGILDVAQVSHNRHEDVCKSVGPCSIGHELIVEFGKFLYRLFLVVEYLYDFLSAYMLLYKSVEGTYGLLLGTESTR